MAIINSSGKLQEVTFLHLFDARNHFPGGFFLQSKWQSPESAQPKALPQPVRRYRHITNSTFGGQAKKKSANIVRCDYD